MTQSAKAQEPSMEEILASIRRIIADDDASKPRPAAAQQSQPAAVPPRAPPPRSPPAPQRTAAPPPASYPAPRVPEPVMNHEDIETMLAGLDAPAGQGSDSSDILDLTESM